MSTSSLNEDVEVLVLCQLMYYNFFYLFLGSYFARKYFCFVNFTHKIFFFSRDCPIFYMRKKVQIELADQDKMITRFGAPAW